MGGEKLTTSAAIIFALGSPPRGRGKAVYLTHTGQGPGITPAWAGKSRCRSRPGNTGWDHPRVGGEKLRFQVISARELGSPPRGRGKGGVFDDFAGLGGITPAWAGKSPDPPTPPTSGGDHPRVGGEKSSADQRFMRTLGSPPRGRGKVAIAAPLDVVDRITPAWAGKSQPMPPSVPRVRDHPRVGGEKGG